MKSRDFIKFEVFDKIVNLHTHTIAICNKTTIGSSGSFHRGNSLSKCAEASLFLDRNNIPLLPQDFEILNNVIGVSDELVTMFNQLETIFSYIYVANSSYILNGKLVFQFNPAMKSFEYDLDTIKVQKVICRIYKWIYEVESAIERAGIARTVLDSWCKSRSQIETMSENIFDSIRSNFVIYQRNVTEQYIEMKNKISEYIIETSKQVQEMTHDMTDGLKNNFLAVIMFLITIILTDSVDWDVFVSQGLSKDITYMSYIFVIASVFYLAATYIAMRRKWSYCEDAYKQIKESYRELLDDADLNRAFDEQVLNNMKKKIRNDIIFIGAIWLLFLLIVLILVERMGNGLVYQSLKDIVK